MSDNVFTSNENTETVVESTEVVETPTTETPTTETVIETPTEDTKWYDTVGEDYKETASKFESPDDLLKEYTNAQALIGRKGAIKPEEGASVEEWNVYYSTLGKPDEPSGYDLPDLFGENADEWVETTTETFKQMAYDSNIPQDQAKALYTKYMEGEIARGEQMKQEAKEANEQCMVDLKNSYGEDTNRMIQLAINVAKEAGIVESLSQSNLGNDPKVVALLADYAKLKGVASNPTLEVSHTNAGTLDEQIMDIRSNPAYGTASPEGKALNTKLEQLYTRKTKGFK